MVRFGICLIEVHVKRRNWLAGTALMVLSTIVLVGMSLYVIARIEQVYVHSTAQSIEHLKRQFLYDAVNNQINRIDTRRESAQQYYLAELDRTLAGIEHLYDKGNGRIEHIISYLSSKPNTFWTVVLWDKTTGNLLLDTHSLMQDGVFMPGKVDYRVHAIRDYGPYSLFIGIAQAMVDEQVKASIAQEIYASKYSEDSYIWVNEVLDYEGGDAYAVRRIHPNLRSTVGTTLSTGMTDVKGTTPYKTELEGVKQNGELFFTYYFKKMNSDTISEKLTYAKLYKDYDWIVAMGIHLDDMSHYIDTTTGQSTRIVKQITPIFIFSMLALFVMHSLTLVFLEHRRNKKREHLLQKQVYQDPLTGIGNRRSGLKLLDERFLQFKQSGVLVMVALFDVDYFKQINDTYGHDIGDRCLVQLANSISKVICTESSIFRWGGDEFLIICPRFDDEELERMKKVLLETARTSYIPHDGVSISLSISVGISTFLPADESESLILKRADKALYQAKQLGRNRCEVEL